MFASSRRVRRCLLAVMALAFAEVITISSYGEEAPRPVWEMFPAGAAPKGALLTEAEVIALEDGALKERLYLIGQFTVTAAGGNRAVFRSAPGSLIRIVVEYPANIAPPIENTIVGRDEARPLLIMNIRRANDGQVTVYTREVIKP
jgi:hypothetical protein